MIRDMGGLCVCVCVCVLSVCLVCVCLVCVCVLCVCVCVCVSLQDTLIAPTLALFTPHAKKHASHKNLHPTQFPNPTALPRCFTLPTCARKK